MPPDEPVPPAALAPLLAIAVVGAVLRGGPVERLGAALLLAGWLAALCLHILFGGPIPWLTAVDTLVLLCLVRLCWRSRRPWPVYATGFQTLTVAADIAGWMRPELDPDLHRGLLSVLGFLTAGTLAAALWLPARPRDK